MFYYDTNGVLRGEIPVLYYRSHRLLFDDDGLMWFSASTHHMVAMNRLGKLEKIYDLGSDYILHHDYAMDSNGDIVLLATEIGRDDNAVQDQVIKLSTSTGSVTSLVDFGELFADYKAPPRMREPTSRIRMPRIVGIGCTATPFNCWMTVPHCSPPVRRPPSSRWMIWNRIRRLII